MMENAKKMILVEPELIDRLKKNENRSYNTMTELDNDMKKIFTSKMSDREKWIVYLQTLQRYLHFASQDRQPFQLPLVEYDNKKDYVAKESIPNKHSDNELKPSVTQEDLMKEDNNFEKELPHKVFYSDSHILRLIPKSYIKKGELLLDTLKQNKEKISWENDGTVIINKEIIPGSNIVHLVSDALRPLKNSEPIGWQRFVTTLKDINLPINLIGNPKRFEYINNLYIKDFKNSSPPVNVTPNTPSSSKIDSKIRKKIDWEKWTPY